MTTTSSPPPDAPAPTPEFDSFAADYDAVLNRGLSLSGESKDFFIDGRLLWLHRRLAALQHPLPTNPHVLDFGCGTGSAFNPLRRIFKTARVTGVDISTAELALAKSHHPWANTLTPDPAAAHPLAADLAYSNGTFHHIPPAQRDAALAFIFHALKPGALFALWENNPYNPGTRWVMSRIPFDKDAITLTPAESRRRARAAGFHVLRTDFLFIFPKFLKPLRPLEPMLSRLPLGAQYQILCRKPS
jgi:SAM-dependent methyltransferase